MSNRQFQRTECSIPVVLFYGPLGLIRGVTIDISPAGMCIDTGIVSLAPNASVNICFISDKENKREVFRLEGQVMYSSSQGTGLQFHNVTPVLAEIA